MVIKFNGEDRLLKFSFNSFEYMQEFNIEELNTIDKYPFKIPVITKALLFGALNHDRKNLVTLTDVDTFLEEYAEENNLADLLGDLAKLLEESSFFKSLQKKSKKAKK